MPNCSSVTSDFIGLGGEPEMTDMMSFSRLGVVRFQASVKGHETHQCRMFRGVKLLTFVFVDF